MQYNMNITHIIYRLGSLKEVHVILDKLMLKYQVKYTLHQLQSLLDTN